jgi:hypothetical protein
MAKVILFPSIMSRYSKLILLSKHKNEILKKIDGIETLYELGIFNPPDQFWTLLTKLVEKKVAQINKAKKSCA